MRQLLFFFKYVYQMNCKNNKYYSDIFFKQNMKERIIVLIIIIFFFLSLVKNVSLGKNKIF